MKKRSKYLSLKLKCMSKLWLLILPVSDHEEIEEEINLDCSNSLYASFDPFDYMYSPSECSQHSDPIYAAVIKTQTPLNSPPPLPPRNNISANEIYVSFNFNYFYI